MNRLNGGNCLFLKALPTQVTEHVYSIVIGALGLDKLSSEERTATLLKCPLRTF